MRFQKQTFKKATIDLDFNEFDGCTFDACAFVFRGNSAFTLTNCSLSDTCSFRFEGPAALTVETLAKLYSQGGGFQAMVEGTIRNIRANNTSAPISLH